MLEFSETYSRLHNLHSIGELDADGDFLIDVGHTVSGILEGILDRIMHLALLTNLCCFRLDLRLFFSGNSCHCYRIDLLMRLPVPFVESWIIRSTSGRFACKELRVLCSARLCRLARPRIPLSRCSSEGIQPGTNARTCSLLQSVATKRTKGSQNLLNCIPSVSFLKRAQRYHFPISCTRRQN